MSRNDPSPQSTASRGVEHTIDEEGENSGLLAELDERKKVELQLNEVKRRTIRPGLMRLPVKKVSSSEENQMVTVTLHHPVVGEITKHLLKPQGTWNPENELIQLLDWYGYKPGNMHHLQTELVYVERISDDATTESDNWEIVRPPEKRGIWDRARYKRKVALTPAELYLWKVRNYFSPDVESTSIRAVAGMALQTSALLAIAGMVLSPTIPDLGAGAAIYSGAIFGALLGVMIGVLLVPPPRREDD